MGSGLSGRTLDLVQAARYYAKSASAGHPSAQVRLSNILLTLAETDVEAKVYKMAIHWLQKAAKNGYAEAQKRYALVLCERDEEEDAVEAAKWMHKAAEQLDPQAAFLLGKFYLQGLGVPENKEEAVRWFAQGAQANYSDAQEALAICYQESWG